MQPAVSSQEQSAATSNQQPTAAAAEHPLPTAWNNSSRTIANISGRRWEFADDKMIELNSHQEEEPKCGRAQARRKFIASIYLSAKNTHPNEDPRLPPRTQMRVRAVKKEIFDDRSPYFTGLFSTKVGSISMKNSLLLRNGLEVIPSVVFSEERRQCYQANHTGPTENVAGVENRCPFKLFCFVLCRVRIVGHRFVRCLGQRHEHVLVRWAVRRDDHHCCTKTEKPNWSMRTGLGWLVIDAGHGLSTQYPIFYLPHSGLELGHN
jgi:hypothetical protein